jgi:hypothetical protein
MPIKAPRDLGERRYPGLDGFCCDPGAKAGKVPVPGPAAQGGFGHVFLGADLCDQLIEGAAASSLPRS